MARYYLGVELDLELVRSHPHRPLSSRRKLARDRGAVLY